MDYLLIKLSLYLVTAFALGLIVGWISCGRSEE